MASNRKLGKRSDQRVALVYNQAADLLWYGEIKTTLERAKEARKVAEKLITIAIKSYKDTVTVKKTVKDEDGKNKDITVTNDGITKLNARRRIMALIPQRYEEQGDKEKKAAFKTRTKDIKFPLVEKLFREYAPKYDKRADNSGTKGGYTQIIHIGNRRGDDATLVLLKLL